MFVLGILFFRSITTQIIVVVKIDIFMFFWQNCLLFLLLGCWSLIFLWFFKEFVFLLALPLKLQMLFLCLFFEDVFYCYANWFLLLKLTFFVNNLTT